MSEWRWRMRWTTRQARSMTTTSQAERAELLRSLHVPGDPLILVNVWDAVSASVVARAPGVRAIATASHAVSAAHGVPDGEGLTLEQALGAAERVVAATDLPVTVDFERGYARDTAELHDNVGRLIATGAVGLNLEDSTGDGLYSIDEQTARIAAVRDAATASGVPLVINARLDALSLAPEGWDDAALRAQAYLAAGADSVFVLGLTDEQRVRRAVELVAGPVAVIASPGAPPIRRLAELGVARVSLGPYALAIALAGLADAAETLTSGGSYPAGMSFAY
ncbi:2-methylisocitrate lyase-like PEP mutase family enzyme [Diaminobutyricimonas aerilata]|uniref:2-methylisocitrate lyase-like PEP mutase family enzyme n=2 Tax=Diaminobutyricimonas aerilata TaxID=1162967 RepID=A0A2M9CP34_9MICO|nr:2-methylisocitrate lyase-like PEP mutase family enzyme [Diaminobutyricimonas aerilata]